MKTATLLYDMQLITAVQRVEGGVRITLGNGVIAHLDADHPNFRILMIHVQSQTRTRYPVGLVMDATGGVLDLSGAHDTPVQDIKEDPANRNHLIVGFWGYSPTCCLTRDHPEFERIHDTLAKEAGTLRMVWVAVHSDERVEGEPDEEGLIPTYAKIMDVRPIQQNEAALNGSTE